MHVRGAGLIGATAAFGMYLASLTARPDTLLEDLQKAASYLNSSRPTAKNLSWATERCLQAAASSENKVESVRTCARSIADEDADFCKKIGAFGKSIIETVSKEKGGKTVNILTHCKRRLACLCRLRQRNRTHLRGPRRRPRRPCMGG